MKIRSTHSLAVVVVVKCKHHCSRSKSSPWWKGLMGPNPKRPSGVEETGLGDLPEAESKREGFESQCVTGSLAGCHEGVQKHEGISEGDLTVGCGGRQTVPRVIHVEVPDSHENTSRSAGQPCVRAPRSRVRWTHSGLPCISPSGSCCAHTSQQPVETPEQRKQFDPRLRNMK